MREFQEVATHIIRGPDTIRIVVLLKEWRSKNEMGLRVLKGGIGNKCDCIEKSKSAIPALREIIEEVAVIDVEVAVLSYNAIEWCGIVLEGASRYIVFMFLRSSQLTRYATRCPIEFRTVA